MPCLLLRHQRRRAARRSGVTGTVLLLALGFGLAAAPTHAQSPPATAAIELPGTSLDSVLAPARQLSPDLAARALDTEAARAKVMVAGSLPDPQFQVMSDDADRMSGPRLNRMVYSFQQDIPLWGRRDLKRQAAEAEAGQMQALARNAAEEVAERAKVAFARYYAAWHAVHRTEDLHRAMHGVAQVAEARYAQGRGEQADVFRAELDTTRVASDVIRLEANLKTAAGQLNALLLRPADAPLAPPQRLPALPDGGRLAMPELLARARQANPSIAADTAALKGAQLDRALADKTWLPDITLGAGAIQRQGWGPPGYQAWVAVKIPLQSGLHDGEVRQAAAQANAARARLDAREQQLQSDLVEAVSDYQASQRTAALIRRQLLPQAEALVRAGMAGYAVDRVDLASVLRSEHDLSDIRLQLLAAEFDSERDLAAIERLIGGDL